MATTASLSAADFLRQHLVTLNPDIMMTTVALSDIRTATGDQSFSYDDMVKAGEEVRSNGFNLVPRHSDDFSPEPYLWITPSPKPVELVDGKAVIPDSFWVIRNPTNTASRRVKEGLMIFSHPGYAAGLMIKEGYGDFNIQPYTKENLVKSGSYLHVVLDYVDGHPLTIIPIDS